LALLSLFSKSVLAANSSIVLGAFSILPAPEVDCVANSPPSTLMLLLAVINQTVLVI